MNNATTQSENITTTVTETEFCTASLKSIYDRIFNNVAYKIAENFENTPNEWESDCGRFTSVSRVELHRDNTQGYDGRGRAMEGACIRYVRRFDDNTNECDKQLDTWDAFDSYNRVHVEVAKRPISDGERTRYITPGKDCNHSVRDKELLDAEDRDDMDCTIVYGTETKRLGDYVWSSKLKARILYGKRTYNFETPDELNCAILDIREKMAANKRIIKMLQDRYDSAQQDFNDKVEHILAAEQHIADFWAANEAIMGGAVKTLEEAGFNKCEAWHREPAEGENGHYEIRMSKDTALGVCSILCYQFREESDWCRDARKQINHRHEVQFGLSFGDRNCSGTATINANELHAKVNKAVAIAELAAEVTT